MRNKDGYTLVNCPEDTLPPPNDPHYRCSKHGGRVAKLRHPAKETEQVAEVRKFRGDHLAECWSCRYLSDSQSYGKGKCYACCKAGKTDPAGIADEF